MIILDQESFFRMYINDMLNTLWEYVFPLFCVLCGREGSALCGRCLLTFDTSGVFDCPVCHEKGVVLCDDCAPSSYIDRHLAILPYRHDGKSGTLIREFKYGFVESLTIPFGSLVHNFFNTHPSLCSSIDIIVPVPLHRRRCAERGFNQAERLAHLVGSALDRPVVPLLARTRHTTHQARLKREARLSNVKDAFSLAGDARDKTILLVDDVFTTGSTIQECAKVLADGGALRVSGFSMARG